MEYHLKALLVNKELMKFLTYVIFSFILTTCSYSQTSEHLTKEDYVILNVFLEQIAPSTHLDLLIINKNPSDSLSFINAYNKKIKLYNSLNNLCLENLKKNETLNYETNFSCSTAEKFKIYNNLFSEKELLTFNKILSSNKEKIFLIDFEKIQVSNIKPLKNDTQRNVDILRINKFCYNETKNKVVVKYSINNRHLYHVLEKKEGWWKNLINFEL